MKLVAAAIVVAGLLIAGGITAGFVLSRPDHHRTYTGPFRSQFSDG